MNQNENTPSMYARKIETLEKIEKAVTTLITRYGRTLDISVENDTLVNLLDKTIPETVKNDINFIVRANLPDILDISRNRHFVDSENYAMQSVKSLTDNRGAFDFSPFYMRSVTQDLITRFANYQQAYGIPPDFATIVTASVMRDGFKSDPRANSFRDTPTTLKSGHTRINQASDRLSGIVKSSPCDSMEFKRYGEGGLPTWDTITVRDISIFLFNVTQRHACWKWITETATEQSNEFRELAGEFTDLLTFDYRQGSDLTMRNTERCLGVIQWNGYIDFVRMSYSDIDLYNDLAMWREMTGHIANLHIFLVTIRAQIELAKEASTFPKTFNETQPQPVEKQVPPVPHSFTIPVQPPVYRRKVASAPIGKELGVTDGNRTATTVPTPVKVTKRKTTKQVPQEPKK